ncbi:class I tRNA ligase family protein, partial [Anaerofustis stercorihominis]|uniref:class I tRNA ligase family protein n=1 Tax=Anaerofustis stercorihominis TaxID=214853 RepID=UPI003995AC02
ESKVEANRNFANKINNAEIFILMNLDDFDENKIADLSKLHNTDKWIISRTNQMVKEVTANIEKYEFGIAAEKLYTFIWNEFCDLYIEFAKPSLNSDNKEDRFNTQYTLNLVFMNILKMLHPYMPFITEHIYSFMPGREDMLIAGEYPEYKEEYDFPKEEEDITIIVEALRTVRNARANMDIPPSKKADGYIFPSSKEMKEVFSSSKDILIKLASFKDINFIDGEYDKEESLCVVVEGGKIFIPMGELIDREKEIERLKNEEKKLNGEISRLEKKLSNKNFTDKAPEKVVEGEREKLKKYQSLMEEVKESLIKLK